MKSFALIKLNLILLVFFIWGCSKNQLRDSMDEVETGRVGLNVRVDGIIEDFGNYTYAHVAVPNKNNSNFNSEILNFNDFDAITSVENLAINPRKPNYLSISNGNNKLASSSPMDQNVYYYLVLYENQNNEPGNFVSKSLMQVGVAKTIYVQTGVSYYWIAYSFNSTVDNLPSVTAENPVIDMDNGKDVLYAKGVTPIIQPDVATYLPITFNHKMARVGIEINTRGLFADIETAEIELGGNYFRSGSLNVRTDIITPSPSSYGNGLKVTSFSNVPNESRQDRKVAFFYTTSTSAISSLTVKLNELKIKLDAEAAALGSPNRVFTYTSSPPTFVANSFAPVVNSTKVFKIDLVESPLTITNGGYYYLLFTLPLGYFNHTVKWARSNLYYENSSYRFQHINTISAKRGSFFSWGSVNPNSYGTNGDPCSLVYPYGVWKMPTATDFYATIGGTVTDVNILNLLKVNLNLLGINLAGIFFPTPSSRNRTSFFTEYTPDTAPSASYNFNTNVDINNKIRFNYNGFYANIGLVENLINLNLGEAGNISRIWTNTANVGLLGVAGVGAVSYSATAIADYMDASVLNLLNINLLGIDVAKTDLNNIRCVRAQ